MILLSSFSYRKKEEVTAIRKERDPIELMSAYGLAGELVTQEELKVWS